jgi:hypothetical protein
MAIEFTEGRYNKALKLNGQNLKLPLSSSEYTVIVNRRKENEALWEQVIKTSDGDIYDDYVLSFDGVDDYVELQQDISLGTTLTIEGVMKTEGLTDNWHTLLGYNNASYNRILFSNGNIYAELGTTNDNISVGIDFSEKHFHFALTRDINNDVVIYIDGEQVATTNLTGSPVFNRIGNSNYYTHGAIDEVRVWGRTKTQQEIQDTMNKTLTGSEDGLVAYYPLNEGTGSTAYDKTLNGNNGTINGAIWERKSDYALSFDGVDDYVALSNLVYESTYSQISIESLFVSPPSSGNYILHAFDRNEYWRIGIGDQVPTDKIGVMYMTDVGQVDSLYSTTTITDGGLHHLAFVFDNGTADLYIDGSLEDTQERGSVIGSGLTRYGYLGVGSESGSFDASKGPHDYWLGKIIDFRIWNTARTQTEIQNNMYTELTGDETGLVAYYKMNEGMGDTLKDHAGNNDGTIYGASWDLSWLGTDSNGDLEINHTAEVVDEAVVIPRVVDTANLEEWNTIHRPFYDNISKSNLAMPTSVIMKEI